jgi:AmmeMemoRadiSam system protein A
VQAGAFVTLHLGVELRGCIGSLETDRPVTEVVERCAASAAREDPRFLPVTPAELDALDIEVSVLGPLEPLDPVDPAGVEIGRHGLVVEQGSRRGLLLPQVATERGWDQETFLAQACAKAGLPADAWRHGAHVCRFEALVFGEHDELSQSET